MSRADQRAARTALEDAAPLVRRLDVGRHAEEVAADLVELWSSIETALRSVMGGSVLSGQPLIREVRRRELISLAQAHAILELLAVRERVDRPEYEPTPDDIQVAHEAYAALEAALLPRVAEPAASEPAIGPAEQPPPMGGIESPVPGAWFRRWRTRWPWLPIVAGGLVLVIVGVGVWFAVADRPPRALARGVEAYEAGRRDAARGFFEEASRARPELALSWIYLGRIAREQGELGQAGQMLRRAVEAEPQSALAQRELGALFLVRAQQFANQGRVDLAQADFDAARRAYVRALQLDPADATAQGFLGCALIRLGRVAEGLGWLQRAGAGPWEVCRPQVQTVPPGVPPAMGP